MGNCLVTRLKEVVNDDNLLKLGELRVKVISDNAYNNNSIISNIPQTLTVSNGTFLNKDGDNYVNAGTNLEVVANRTVFIWATKGSIISIPNKYKLKHIIFANCYISGSLEDLLLYLADDFRTCVISLTDDVQDNKDFYGDISCLKHIPHGIEPLSLGFSNLKNITGDIAIFDDTNVNYSNLKLKNTSVYGDIRHLKNVNVFSIEKTNVSGNLETVGLDQFAYTDTTLDFSYTKVVGNIRNIRLKSNITVFKAVGCPGVVGDDNDLQQFLTNNPHLINYNFLYSGVTATNKFA